MADIVKKAFDIGFDKVKFRYSEKSTSDIYNMYKSNEYIYSAINVRAENLAAIEFIGDNKFTKIIKSPNPTNTFYEVIYDISKSIDLYGYVYIGVRGNNIYVLKASDVQVLPKDRYQYLGDEYASVEFDRIIKITLDDSPVQALYQSAEIFELIKIWNSKNIKNGGFSGRIITPKTPIDAERLTELADMMRTVVSGVDNQNKSVVFNDEVIIQDLFKPSEMDYSVLLEACRNNILSALRVPREMVGIMNDSNRASSTTAVNSFVNNVITPRCTLICAKLSTIGFGAITFIKPSNQTSEDRLNETVQLFINGIITVDEARELVGYGAIKTDSKSIKKHYKKDIGDIKRAHLSMYDACYKDLESQTKRFFRDKKVAVLSRLGNKMSDANIDYIAGDESIEAVITAIYLKYGVRVLDELKDDGFDYPYTDMRVWLSDTAKDISKKIDDTTYNDIKDSIIKAGATGAAINELLNTTLDNAINYRSVAISTSESTRIINGTKNEVYMAPSRVGDGVIEKIWVTMHDNLVRHTHQNADGQVSKNGVFIVGGEELEYPGDIRGSAANTINCRCTITHNI